MLYEFGMFTPDSSPVALYGYIPIRPYKIEIQITTGDESDVHAVTSESDI